MNFETVEMILILKYFPDLLRIVSKIYGKISYKSVVLSPRLKKPGADYNKFYNF